MVAFLDKASLHEDVDNVREWVRAMEPAEYQIPKIDPSLTFGWFLDHALQGEEWDKALRNLDTALRESVTTEAIRRFLKQMSLDWNYSMAWIKRIVESLTEEWLD